MFVSTAVFAFAVDSFRFARAAFVPFLVYVVLFHCVYHCARLWKWYKGLELLHSPPHPVHAIANIITSPDGQKVFLLKGDRHFWTDDVKSKWEAAFHEKDERGEGCKGAPFQVYTVSLKALRFQGNLYSPEDVARYILQHMLSKKWVPRCVFPTDEDKARALQGGVDVSAVADDKIQALFELLQHFTDRVSDLHYHETVMGAVEGGATRDIDQVRATLHKETQEEAGLCLDGLQTSPEFFGFSKPRAARKTGKTTVTALWKMIVAVVVMQETWDAENAKRRPADDNFSRWWCAHAWWKCIPGIDAAAAEHEKATLETRDGQWHDMKAALARENFLDRKNRDMIQMDKTPLWFYKARYYGLHTNVLVAAVAGLLTWYF